MTAIKAWRLADEWWVRHRRTLIRYVIVAAVLVASYYLAPRAAAGGRLPTLAVLGLGGAVLAGTLLHWPALGLILCMLGGMLVPIVWQGGFNLSQLGVAGMLGIWFLDMLVSKKQVTLVRSRTLLPLLAFVAASVFSFGLGQFSWYPFARNAPIEAQVGGLAIHLLSAGAFLLVAHLVTNLRQLALFTWTFIALGTLYMLGRVLGLAWIDRVFQHGFTAGSLFWVWLVALLGGQLVANQHLKLPQRGLLGGIVGLVFYVALVQGYDWKSGWFPPLVGLAVIITLRYWSRVKYAAILALIPFYYLATASIGQEDWSWGTRLDAWIIVLGIAQVSPVFGMGFANYYWYAPLFPIRGYAVSFNSHSQIIDLIAQTGLVGLGCFTWFLGELGLLAFRLAKSVPEGFARGYVYGALGGLAGTIVAAYLVDWVLPFVYNIGMQGFRASVIAWFFMGGLVSVEQVMRRNAAP